ncbi:alpha/beta hydrolase [Vibrio parahaemolyticus]|uniref:alpha/beta hydrolase n=1 Tax=Vibrio parahaemolyticus TaxID=670 RepID=UPI00301D0D81
MFEILIVEDDKTKSDAVCHLLEEIGVYGSSVTLVNNVRDALLNLSSNSYDILILDLNLPIRSDSIPNPRPDSGVTILSKLELEQYNTPDTIIGLTSFCELKNEYEYKFNELAFTLFLFESNDWKTAITNKVTWLKKSLRQKEIVSKRENHKELTILVHGVMTAGNWQVKLKGKLEEKNHQVELYEYKFYSALKIVLGLSRDLQKKHFENWLERIIINNPSSRINIVAHSFGTYLSIKALESLKLDNMTRINNIVLLGSVLPRNHDFSLIERKFLPKKIINECGTKDKALLASKALCIGLGNAGRLGFNSNSKILINRFYDAGHSIFDEIPDYFEIYWESYVTDGVLILSERSKKSRTSEVLESLLDTLNPLFLIFVFLIVLVFCLV